MYRIALIEDEVYALRALERKILDLGGPYAIAGTASGGVEGLALVLRTNPAVVLTDIRMPDMDGITLIRKLKEAGCSALTVIVSGYQEFEYAKQAVQLGAQDYLLKPVDPGELGACLERCVAVIRRRRRESNAVSFFIGDGTFSLELGADHAYFAVGYLVIANALEHFDYLSHPSAPYVSAEAVEAAFAGRMCEGVSLHCYDAIFSNEKALILSCRQGTETALGECLRDGVTALGAALQKPVNLYYALCDDADAIGYHVRECRKGVTGSIRLGESGLFTGPAPPPAAAAPGLKEQADLFALLLRQGDGRLLESNIQRMLDVWQAGDAGGGRPMAAMEDDLIFLLRLIAHSLDASWVYPADIPFLVENMLCFCDSYQDLADNLPVILTELFSSALRQPAKGASAEAVVAQIESFFQSNLRSNITLQMLSDETGLSKAYLCRVYRKVRDMTPIDYFTRLKIESAQQLMARHPTMGVREVAEYMGFGDMYYFSKVFKRITGVPPSEYRG